jgi:hypothetical protein
MVLLPWAWPTGVFRLGQLNFSWPTWPFGPGLKTGELALMASVDGGSAESRRLPAGRVWGARR